MVDDSDRLIDRTRPSMPAPDNPYAPPSERASSTPPPHRRRYSTEELERSRRTRVPAIFGYLNLGVSVLSLVSAVALIVADRYRAVPEAPGQLTSLGGVLAASALLLLVPAVGLIGRRRWAPGMAMVWFVLSMATLTLAGSLGLARGKAMLFAGAFAVALYACIYGLIMVVAVNKRYVRAALNR